MILSQKQYAETGRKLAMLEASLDAPPREGAPTVIVNAARAQTRELIDELRGELAGYEAAVQADPDQIPVESLDDLLAAPIRYRLATRMSTEAFARKVGVSARQIFRYEQEGYLNCSMPNFVGILGALDLRLVGRIAPAAETAEPAVEYDDSAA